MYKPNPIDTGDIVLSDDIERLVEELAKNTHDVWALQRIQEGWIYGERRNDTEKTHPGLVEYAELPESEKEYDRNTARETLKFIIKLGYQITKS